MSPIFRRGLGQRKSRLQTLADTADAMLVLKEPADIDLPGKPGDIVAMPLCRAPYTVVSEAVLAGAFVAAAIAHAVALSDIEPTAARAAMRGWFAGTDGGRPELNDKANP